MQVAVLAAAVVATALSLMGAEQPAPANLPGQGILVLRNGQTIEGRITRTDKTYLVDLGDGLIHVKDADVDLVCSNLEEGYRQKRAAIQVGNVSHHLELAQWCLRHGLLEQAGAEVADARLADPNHPMLGAIEHRLQMALEPPPTADTAHKPLVGPSNEELDRMVRSLPHGAVETFTQSVQPVLMNHCATAGCHGPQAETGLRLFRVSTGKSASRRVTQRNLYAVLPFVDQANPTASRLLTVPNGPHGTAKHAIFSEHQALQYKRMVDWATQLANGAAPEVPTTITPSDPSTPVPVQIPPQMLSQEAKKARPLHPAENHTAKRGAAPASFDQPADPFDPEAFNRRYAPRKSEAKKEPSQ